MRRLLHAFLIVLTLTSPLAVAQEGAFEVRSVNLTLAAVAENPDGSLAGVTSSLEVRLQRPGTGRVYVSTEPFTQLDMQGSARLAAAAAHSITGMATKDSDLFYAVRSDSTIIGGPSAGAAMAAATTALLMGWTLEDGVVMTGTINPDASIGPVGGIVQKLEASAKAGARTFLVPLGQTWAAAAPGARPINVTEYGRDQLNVQVVEVADLYGALPYLTGYEIRRPASASDPVRDDAYQAAIRELAQQLSQQTSDRANALQQRLEALDPTPARGDEARIRQELDQAAQLSQAAAEALGAGQPYVAASHAFRAQVGLERAAALIEYFEGDAPSFVAHVDAYREIVQQDLRVSEAGAAHLYPVASERVDTLGAAETRLQEANRTLAQSADLRRSGRALDALDAAAYARARLESGQWWQRLGPTDEAPRLEEALVRALVQEYEEAAALNVQYAQLLLGSNPLIEQAQRDLDAAAAALRSGYLEGALLGYVDALAGATTALVTAVPQYPTAQRLPVLAAEASYMIGKARAADHPVYYATSRFELARTMEEAQPADAYQSYTAARLAAQAALAAANVTSSPAQAENVGVPSRPNTPVSSRLPLLGAFAAGVLTVLTIRSLIAPSRPPRSPDAPALTIAASAPPPPPAVPQPPVTEKRKRIAKPKSSVRRKKPPTPPAPSSVRQRKGPPGVATPPVARQPNGRPWDDPEASADTRGLAS